LIKEGEIDAALSEAQEAVAQLAEATGASLATEEAPRSEKVVLERPERIVPAVPAFDLASLSPAFQRLFKLKVVVRVRLAERRMSVGDILQLANGAILEFDTPVHSELKLLVNNKCVGTGEAVKVGENFGLRVRHVGETMARDALTVGTV